MDDRGGDGSKVAGIRQIESCTSPKPSPDVPKGYLAVYVGSELRRFIIPTSYLTHPVFKILLEKAEEEFRYNHNGGLTLPCEIETFKYLLKCIENHPKGYLVENSVPKQVMTHEHLVIEIRRRVVNRLGFKSSPDLAGEPFPKATISLLLVN
ncbi:hypothetical protein Godav_012771, partial [Gossypium davidsonii]|nr:hypothetical protein [Gossypium davidsonii]